MPKRKRTPVARDADLISALPDALLHKILWFLQAQEAVQTCVLGRRWRNLWKSMPVLRVTGGDPVESVQEFMDHLLLLRDRSELDACVFEFGSYSDSGASYVNLWIRHALLWCQVRELAVAVVCDCRMVNELDLDNLPVVSPYLAKLNLRGLSLDHRFLDFSSCPALKDLSMTECNIFGFEISSRSLEHLRIRDCKFVWDDSRAHISAPSLVSLQINGVSGLRPSFEEMPALLRATVDFGIGDGSSALTCIMHHSPALEILTIQLSKVFLLHVDFACFQSSSSLIHLSYCGIFTSCWKQSPTILFLRKQSTIQWINHFYHKTLKRSNWNARTLMRGSITL